MLTRTRRYSQVSCDSDRGRGRWPNRPAMNLTARRPTPRRWLDEDEYSGAPARVHAELRGSVGNGEICV